MIHKTPSLTHCKLAPGIRTLLQPHTQPATFLNAAALITLAIGEGVTGDMFAACSSTLDHRSYMTVTVGRVLDCHSRMGPFKVVAGGI